MLFVYAFCSYYTKAVPDQSTRFIISRIFDQLAPSQLPRANNNREAGNLRSSNRQSLLNTVRGCFDSKHSNTELLWSRGYLTSERLQSLLKCLLTSVKVRGREREKQEERDAGEREVEKAYMYAQIWCECLRKHEKSKKQGT